MKLVVFGLTVSSSWGNGHAALWRGMIKALSRRGHRVVFFEHNLPYYANTRDMPSPPGANLVIYPNWESVAPQARRELADADVAIVTSYCPDGIDAAALILQSSVPVKVFYDIDTPVTLQRLKDGKSLPYLPPEGLAGFDLVLSYAGGQAIEGLRRKLAARHVVPLYAYVDPEVHRPAAPMHQYRCDLSCLCAYAPDRQATLEELLVKPARLLPGRRFVIGGPQYPADFPWTENIHFVPHLPAADHPAFYCSSRLTLSVTRQAMAQMGYCPCGRLFEAAACGAALLSDYWEGIETFFVPGEEILVARTAAETIGALGRSDAELARIARRGQERVLSQHTADHRAAELERILEQAGSSLQSDTASLRSLQSTGFPFAISEGAGDVGYHPGRA